MNTSKKIGIMFFITSGLLFASSSNVKKPKGYTLINEKNPASVGLRTYESSNKNIYVIDAPTGKSNIAFGVSNNNGTNRWGDNKYKKISIKLLYNKYDYGDLYTALNGQFYNFKTGSLSWQLKGFGNLYRDNDPEKAKGKRLLAILKGGLPIVYKGTSKQTKIQVQNIIGKIINKKQITDAIVGLDPFDEVVKRKVGATSKKGRNMIGCIPYKKYDRDYIAVCKNILFFIAKDKKATQDEIIEEMKKWDVKKSYMITNDGSGSAQAFSKDFTYNNKDFWLEGDKRPLSSTTLIYSK